MDTPLPSRSPADRDSARRFLPRFSLRALLILAIVCCLLFGWVGRNLYRVRQEQAAIETLKQAEGSYQFASEESFEGYDALRRLVGAVERPKLASVSLRCRHHRDQSAVAAIEALKYFPEIESVALSGSAFNDDSVRQLFRFPNLDSVALVGTSVTGDGLAELADLKIQNLVWSGRPSKSNYSRNDDDASKLADLADLERLKVVSVTDVALDRLAPLANLKSLEVCSPVTVDAARKFSASHPACRVTHLDYESLRFSPTIYLAGEIVTAGHAESE